MPLAAGTRLGPCEVLGPVGPGGMGQVYKFAVWIARIQDLLARVGSGWLGCKLRLASMRV